MDFAVKKYSEWWKIYRDWKMRRVLLIFEIKYKNPLVEDIVEIEVNDWRQESR